MSVRTFCVGCLIALISISTRLQVYAVSIDIFDAGFSSFAPNPIDPGQRPTSFGYAFKYTNSAPASARFTFSIVLSSNSIFGDPDDISLGTLTGAANSLNGVGGSISGTMGNPNGITSFQVPAGTVPGKYNAFLFMAPLSPHVDPDAEDAIGLLSGTVRVGAIPALPGDYTADGNVDAADYTIWRDNFGTNFVLNGNGDETGESAGVVDAADYDLWKAHFGASVGAGALSVSTVPEPSGFSLLLIGLVGCVCSHGSSRRYPALLG